MLSFKFFALLLIVSLSATVASARTSSSSGGGGRSRGSSSSGGFWFAAYAFDNNHWPSMGMSRSDFAADNVAKMWKNRPAQAQAAVCFQGSWRVKNLDQVSSAMTVAYFHKTFWTKKVYMYDCLYVWGPRQSWWSWDDADDNKMAWAIDDTKCTFNSTVYDIDCL